MAEIRNLTRNGETFYPLTHVDAIVSNTGSGIDDVPTAGSENLVKSGGVYDGLDEVLYKSLEFVKKSVSNPVSSTVVSGIPGSDGYFVSGTGFESLLYNISDVIYANVILKASSNGSFISFLKSIPIINEYF